MTETKALDDLLDRFRKGDRVALARVLSHAENSTPGFPYLFDSLFAQTGRALRLGVTGPPGAGKSTLVEALAAFFRENGGQIGVVAVDPTSPFSGGALLGDRVRMQKLTLDPGVFVRSMASRGSVGGLAQTTDEVADIMDAFGFDTILIETVGVGQSEVDVASSASTTLVVLFPGAGDNIQAMKAGLMEIADIFVVNKADQPGADRVEVEIGDMLELRAKRDGWKPPILKCSALDGDGIAEVREAIDRHTRFLSDSGELARQRTLHLKEKVKRLVEAMACDAIWTGRAQDRVLDEIVARHGALLPFRAAREIVNNVFADGGSP